ncbi:ABC transporter ATP-binding protein [Anaerobacillus arseniciselenatis]|uniref:ABC transporter ATP-binding protein n=1 Tax=Anaerobacillus arseniciselenatis TaxID=85682 RepID=A0A1S2LWA5_9BACI|nr:ABC transporter ATP-binding protein [Anaerobacillus arseniciselenatis]OIJ15635.1 ABC transporter ATP-binding protein [Anaerobacillus arseniciselenatis]
MLKVLSFLKSYKKPIYIALLLMFVELFVELLSPLFIAKIIDEGILKNDLSVVLIWGGIMVGLSLVGFAAGIINSFYSAHVSQSFGYDVRKSLFDKVQSFSFANLNRFPTSSLITRLTNDVTQIQVLVFMALRIAARAPLLVIGGVVMALIVNWRLALILVVAMPLLLLFMVWLMSKGVKLFRAVQEKLDAVNSVMRENLSGMRLIKAFLRKKHEQERFAKTNHELKDETVTALRLIELTMPVLLLVMNLSILVILWFGSAQVNANQANVGEIVALINYATRIMFAFSVFSFILMGFARAKASSARISEVLDVEVDLTDGEGSLLKESTVRGNIQFDQVSFKYPNTDEKVLKEISFDVRASETVAILGATGSGKSSLFQLIPRLYDVNSGAIYLDHQNVKTMKLEFLRKQIGYVPQEARLFSGTVKENICWGKENATMDEIVEAAKAAQIHETIVNLPQQYETILGQRGVNLSGGQKQRLSIARALIRKPKILLLDDSTSALDLQTEAKILEAIKKQSCTTFIITQKISTVMVADNILLLEDGMIVANGKHNDLMKKSPLYQKIYASQHHEEVVGHG